MPGVVLLVETLARGSSPGITGGGRNEIEDAPDVVRGRL